MEEIVALIFIIFGTVLGGLILWKIFDVVRSSITKNKLGYDEDKFDRLAKAFIQHRNDTEKRLQNIEAIVTEGSATSISSSNRSLDRSGSQSSIEIEADDEQEEQKSSSGNLSNMLDKKRTT
jgi:hypothetical protein